MKLALATMPLLFAAVALSFSRESAETVDNFQLLDHNGEAHELHYYSDAKAIVLMVHGNGCPIVRLSVPRLAELRDTYHKQGVVFLLINANLQDDRDAVAAEAEEFGIDFPILIDDTQLVGEMLGLTRTAEAIVIDPRDWTIAYRGAIDDRIGYETQQAEAKRHYLADALDALLAGKAVAVPRTEAKGCIVNLPETARRDEHAKISYEKQIAPLLIDKCVTCHRPGGIGPFAMRSYNTIRGFAPMIREVLLTKRMPPWHADPHIGAFLHDRSLTPEQTRMLVHWIEAGAPRGEGVDPLADFEHDWPEWKLGEPDLIIDIPAFDVPATGVIDYQYQMVENPLDEDVWVRAVEILPGSRKALHHVITTIDLPDRRAENGRRTIGGLGGYVPGARAEQFPDDTGVLLPRNALITFQMHYTTFGKAVTDRSRLGIYFHKQKPRYKLEHTILYNTDIRIPPGVKAHSDSATHDVKRDMILYALLPHAHFRGKSSKFTLVHPDGREEVILSVPDYDFNWQTTYYLEEPLRIAAGAKLVHTTTWDNSAQNPANPDPTKTVRWGEQSWDEMLFGSVIWRRAE